MAKVRASVVEVVLGYVGAAGGDAGRVRAASGLRGGDLVDPERMLDVGHLAATLGSAADELGDPAVGLHLGAGIDLEALGLLTYAVLNAASVETSLNNLVRYLGTLIPGARAELVNRGESSVLRVGLDGADPEAFRHVHDGGVLVLLRMLRRLVGDDAWQPEGVALAHGAPGDAGQHRCLFGVEPAFAQRVNEIRFETSLLSRQVIGADRFLLPIVEQRIHEVFGADAGDEPWLAQLRLQIAMRLCDGHPGLKDLAPRIGLSPRTLQRRLAERGLVYRDLVQQTRRRLALRYLEHTGTELTEVAFLLGYSELAAFAHAFRRWTGHSPGAHRRACRGYDGGLRPGREPSARTDAG